MQNIIATIPGKLRIETYVKGNHVDPSVKPVDFFFGQERFPLAIEAHDEVPCFFIHKDGYFGAIKISKKDAISDKIINDLGQALKDNGLHGEDLEVIMGPSLGFSHTPVESEELEAVLPKYRGACKITSGVNYLDIPLMCFLQFRALGVHMANIHCSDYDTFENPSLLYSKTRGEEEENVTLATLL